MKNLIVAIGGTRGCTLRSLKYRLGLFNTLGGTDETVEVVYIDTLSRNQLESGVVDEGDRSWDMSYLTLGKHDVDSYVEYRGGGITDLADRLVRDPAWCHFTDQELRERHAYRWFSAPYYRGIHQATNLEKVEECAGQYRQFGRLMIDRNYDYVASALMKKIRLMDNNFRVFMVFSVLGQTGSAAAFDTVMILRSLAAKERKVPTIYAFLVVGRAFDSEDTSRTYAAFRELSRLGSRDSNAVYTVDYRANPDNRTVLNRELFDGKFIVDFHEGVSELRDDNLRYLGLYPSLADLMELMIEPSAGRYLYEAATNWPRNVQAARTVQDHQVLDGNMADGQHAYQLVRQGLNAQAQHDDWFVTYKTHRIFFPKDIYLEISRNQLIKQFLKGLFPYRGDYSLKDNLSLKTGEEISGEALEKEKNENCYDILKSWNRSFMGSVSSDRFRFYKPFHDRELSKRFDYYSLDDILGSLFIYETEMGGLIEIWRKNIRQDLSDSVVRDAVDIPSFIAALEIKCGETQTRIEDALKLQDVTNKNVIRLRMARHAVNMLNTRIIQESIGIAAKRGTLAFTREVFRHLALHYLKPINSRLVARLDMYRARVDELTILCNECKSALAWEGGLGGDDLVRAQRELLAIEQERLEQIRALEANVRLIEYVEFATDEANRWLDRLKDWGHRLVSSVQDCLRLKAEKSVAEAEWRLLELAMSAGVSVGLPRHEFPLTQEGVRQARSFDTVKTDMGGFQQYVHELLGQKALIREWAADFGWAVSADIDGIEGEVPEDRLIDPIVPEISMSDAAHADGAKAPTKITDESDFFEQLRGLADSAAEPLRGINLFTYLTEWVPNNTGMTWHDVAGEIGSHFRSSELLLDCDANCGLWHSYLAYNAYGNEVPGFVANVAAESVGPHEPTPTEIPNYGDGNSLAFVHFAVGVTIEDSPTLRQLQEAYIEHIRLGRSSVGLESHYIGETLSNHISPEEQAMLRFEIENLQLPDGGEFTAHDLVPVELSPLFEDLNRLDLFVQLYAAHLIWCEPDDNDRFFWYRSDPDLTHPAQPRDKFKLNRGVTLVAAARRFVANEPNLDASSAFAYLPSATEMQNNLHDCIDVYLSQDNSVTEMIKNEYTDKAARHIAMRHTILERSIKTIEAYAGQDLERHFEVNFGVHSRRHTVSRDRLRTIILQLLPDSYETS